MTRRKPRYFGFVQSTDRGFPEAPHDPRERVRVTSLGSWEVRVYTEARARTLVPAGLWQLQLWEPNARLSVITPSLATSFAYEALSMPGCFRVRVETRADLLRLMAREYAGSFVSEAQLSQLESWLVPTRQREVRVHAKD